jgi:hypothetical protein
MKAIHNKPLKKELPLVQWLTEARQLESKDRNAAIKEYKQIALAFPSDERAFNRLMVLFRQMRKPKDELYWINKAISSFQAKFQKSHRPPGSAVSKLSKKIAHFTGLADKKGNSVFQTPPLDRWLKRKDVVQGKMG